MKRVIVFVLAYLGVIGLLSIPLFSIAEEGKWTIKSDIPTPRGVLSASVVNGKIYAIGGQIAVNGVPKVISTVEEYDPVTDKWTKKADMPTARAWFSTSAVNGKIYAIGGAITFDNRPFWFSSIPTVEEYDPANDKWIKKANMPIIQNSGPWGLTTSVVNEKIYVIGGWDGKFISMVLEYNPATDTWVRKKDMPTPRAYLSSAVVNGKIYAIGGQIIQSNGGPVTSIVEEYNPVTDTWTRKADMLTARMYLSVTELNGRIYATGGAINESEVIATIEEYDPITDRWVKKGDMLNKRGVHSAVTVNGKIYIFGGGAEENTPPYTTMEEYDPGTVITTNVESKGKLTGTWAQLKKVKIY